MDALDGRRHDGPPGHLSHRDDHQRQVQHQAGGLQFDPSKSLFQVEDHVAQTCLYTEGQDVGLYQRWIFFDDLWANAHSDLANAILAHARRWDVLS